MQLQSAASDAAGSFYRLTYKVPCHLIFYSFFEEKKWVEGSDAALIKGGVVRFSRFIHPELKNRIGGQVARVPWATGELKLFLSSQVS